MLRGLLIQTRPTDPLTLILIAGLVIVFTVAASLIPALRAAARIAAAGQRAA
jgi:ABC-type lipoprotein release transport system permease subunit